MAFFKKNALFLLFFVAHIGCNNDAFSIIASKQTRTASTFINPEGHKELFYSGIVTQLSRCQTPFGLWGLQEMLHHPATNIRSLQDQQHALELLITDQAVYQEYAAIIRTLAKPHLLSYWRPENPLHQRAHELYYDFFGLLPKIRDYLNSSKLALNLSGNVNSFLTVCGYIGVRAASSFIKESVFATYHNITPQYPNALKSELFYPAHLHNPFISYFNEIAVKDFSFITESHKLSGGDWTAYFETFVTNKNLAVAAPAFAFLAAGLTLATYDYFLAQDIKNQIKTIKDTYKTSAALKIEIIHIARWYNACKQLHTIAQKYPSFSLLPQFQLIKKYVHDQHVSPELKKLFELLTTVEQQSSSIVGVSTGTVLLTHKLLDEIKDELIPLMQGVGLCDALLSIVNLYHEHAQSPAPFCLPEFTHITPAVEGFNFWHPGLTNKAPVANSVELGHCNSRNIVITGPNGGGKSTVMAALSWGIILAHAWGIAPAQRFFLSVFSGVRTFLSPQADLEQGLSTFMAEKRRLDNVIKTVQNLKETDTYFFIIDEPCRGTIERVAEQFVMQLGKALAQSERCVSVLATHLEKPTTLATQTNSYTNFHMELVDTGTCFIRTFKLLPGAADWWFNDEPTRTRFLLEL